MKGSEKREVSQEIEVKLQLMSPDEMQFFWEHPLIRVHLEGEPKVHRLLSIYYDTADHRMLKHGLIYRVRSDQDDWIATVKKMGQSEGGFHQRDEWNMFLPDGTPRPDLLEEESIREEVMTLIGNQALAPLVYTEFQRTLAEWTDHSGNRIEIALDQGIIEAGKCQRPIQELELELKHGSPEAMLLLASELSEQIPMKPESASKFHRGLELIHLAEPDHKNGKDSGSKNVSSLGRQQLHEAVPSLFEDVYLDVVKTVERLHMDPKNPKLIHEFRVNVRRYRSVLSFFKPILPTNTYETLQLKLRQWTSQMARLRELDVMQEHFDLFWEETSGLERTKQSDNPLQKTLQTEREQERDKVAKRIDRCEMTPVMFEIWHLTRILCEEMEQSKKNLNAYAGKRTNEWITEFEKKGRITGYEEITKLHRLRIRGKKIRYVMEWLHPIIPKISCKSVKVMKKLQDLLGEMHDIHCETLHMRRWVDDQPSSPEIMTALGMYEGWQTRREFELSHQLKYFWKKAVKKL